MVQLTTTHDAELNQKVFRVRGDEGYARKTNIDIVDAHHITPNTVATFNASITVNVYRAIEDSAIAIVDNGTTIQLVDWDGSVTSDTILVEGLAYDVEHTISAKYLGNGKCLSSRSNELQFFETNPDVHTTRLVNTTSSNRNSMDGGTVSARLEDTTTNPATPLSNKPVNIYVNGEKLNQNIIRTNSSGVVYYNCAETGNNQMPKGLNNVEFVYEGQSDSGGAFTRARVNFDYSVGRKLTITSYPEVFINNVNAHNIITGTITDYFNEPYEGLTVWFDAGQNPPSAVSDTNGNLTFDIDWVSDNMEHRLVSQGSYSEYITTHSTSVTGIDMAVSNSIVTPATSSNVTVKIKGGNIRKGLAVTVTGGNLDNTYYTDESGMFTMRYAGTGYGDMHITASCGDISQTVHIEDLLFYYGNEAQNYTPHYMFKSTMQPQTDGVRFNIPDYSYFALGLGSGNEPIGDFELTFTQVQAGKSYGLVTNVGTWHKDEFNNPIEVRGGWYGTGTTQEWGTKFKIIRRSGNARFYQLNSWDVDWWDSGNEWHLNDDFPILFMHFSGERFLWEWDFITFNEIKLKKLR